MISLGSFQFDASQGRVVTRVSKTREPHIAILEAPNQDIAIKQFLGKADREITLEGALVGSNAQSDKATLESMRDSGSTYLFSDGNESFNVIITATAFAEEAGRPNYIRFSLTLREAE